MSKSTQTTINFTVRKSDRIKRKITKDDTTIVEPKQINDNTLTQKRRDLKKKNINENEDKQLCHSPAKLKKYDESSETDAKKSSLSKAKMVMSLSYIKNIVERDNECEEIREFIINHLNSKESASLYISGAAGTGKSASVNAVSNQLINERDDFNLLYINCMTFRTSSAIYGRISKELNIQSSAKSDVSNDIRKYLTGKLRGEKSNKKMTVLVLDEIDQLESKSHEVLYTIFEWPIICNSRLILIGIANALDFTTRILKRLNMTHNGIVKEFHFHPYNKDQIIKIIEDRLKSVDDNYENLFKCSAIQLCARKIASCSGDIRKALDVCRRAIELIENAKDDKECQLPLKVINDHRDSLSPTKIKPFKSMKCVEIPEIMSVLNQVYGQRMENTKSNSKQCLPFQQQIILCSLLKLTKQLKSKEIAFGKCQELYGKICKNRRISSDAKSESEFLNMIQLLESHGFVSIKSDAEVRRVKISLKVEESEIQHEFTDKTLLNSILFDT